MTTIAESPWRTTSEVLDYLRISRMALSRNMDRFSYGVHFYRKIPGNKHSKIVWNIVNLEKFFCTPVAYKKKTVDTIS